jgi:hypothetical protein
LERWTHLPFRLISSELMTSGSLNPKWNQRPIQFEDSSHDPAASEKAENMRIRKAKSTWKILTSEKNWFI